MDFPFVLIHARFERGRTLITLAKGAHRHLSLYFVWKIPYISVVMWRMAPECVEGHIFGQAPWTVVADVRRSGETDPI
ncbi:hypothetical protein EB232_03990 [Mesorhizobium sp. NZP2077]|nr:hypothetical protein EB232_03990 [Mesorhizobium sp. NZP2077]